MISVSGQQAATTKQESRRRSFAEHACVCGAAAAAAALTADPDARHLGSETDVLNAINQWQ